MKPSSKHSLLLFAIALPAIVSLGCKKEEQVHAYSAPKDVVAAAPTEADGQVNPEPVPPDEADESMHWTLPAGWTEVAVPDNGKGFHADAVFQVSTADPKVLVKVSHLGDAPGARSIWRNVIRWQGELQIPQSTEADVSKDVKSIPVGDLVVNVVRLDNATDTLLGLIIPHGSDTWFVKLSGPRNVVASQESQFIQFMGSLNFGAPGTTADSKATAPSPEPPSSPPATDNASTGADGAQWTLPNGWTMGASKPGRVATIRPSNGSTEIAVSKFGALGGGLGFNVTRWRGMVGLDPVDDAHADVGQQVTIGGRTWTLHDYTGPKDGGTRVIIAQTEADGVWFFKLLGPTDAVGGVKVAFDEFIGSVKFAP